MEINTCKQQTDLDSSINLEKLSSVYLLTSQMSLCGFPCIYSHHNHFLDDQKDRQIKAYAQGRHSLASNTLLDFSQILKILSIIFIKRKIMKLSYLLNVYEEDARCSFIGNTV